MHPTLKSPGMTTIWKDALDRVCDGNLTQDAFITELINRMDNMVKYALATRFSEMITGKRYNCPGCGSNLVCMESKNHEGKFFWFCSNGREKGCPPRSNFNGAPGAAFAERATSGPPCTTCEEGFLQRIESNRRIGFFFWACSTGKEKGCPPLLDENGKPGKPMIDQNAPKLPCPYEDCEHQVTRIQSMKNKIILIGSARTQNTSFFMTKTGNQGEKWSLRISSWFCFLSHSVKENM